MEVLKIQVYDEVKVEDTVVSTPNITFSTVEVRYVIMGETFAEKLYFTNWSTTSPPFNHTFTFTSEAA